jgi:hypothetical protein
MPKPRRRDGRTATHGGEDTIRNSEQVKDRGKAGPFGILTGIRIEQTPARPDHILLKDRATLKRWSRATARPGVGIHLQFRLAITTGKRRKTGKYWGRAYLKGKVGSGAPALRPGPPGRPPLLPGVSFGQEVALKTSLL